MHALSLLALLAAAGAAQDAARVAPSRSVSPQGILLPVARDPGLRVTPLRGDCHHLECALDVLGADGSSTRIEPVRGNAFLRSDVGRIVAIEAGHSGASRLAVLDGSGAELQVRTIVGLTDPGLSTDGAALAYRAAGSVVVVDLGTLVETHHPNLDLFVAGPGGLLVGVRPGSGDELVVRDARGELLSRPLPGRARRVALAADGATAYAITADSLVGLDIASGATGALHAAPEGSELRDLRLSERGLRVGLRTLANGITTGSVVTLTPGGFVSGPGSNPLVLPLAAPANALPVDSIPWPLAPNAQHPVGNTYAEYQNYGGSPYMHPGVDVLGADHQPVFAVRAGVVKAILTTSGQYHWRVAIADEGGAGTSEGDLYAHLDLPTIAVNVGDTISAGQYLGDLVPWPVAGFTHVHFARIEDTGVQWFGDWLCTENPHVRFQNHGENQAPVFEPAIGADLFAFCNNETSIYQDPDSLTGKVDIVVHVGDVIGSSWVCAVQEIRYTIYPVGSPGSPVVDDKLAVRFDMALDTYQDGPIDPFLVDLLYKEDSTCDTDGDYSDREFFHVITNSDGDDVYEASDQQEAWDTAALPDGDWVIEVTATDAAGNSTTASMTVTTDN